MIDLYTEILDQLSKLQYAAERATPGPWVHVDHIENSGTESTYMGCGSVITMAPHLIGGDVAAPNGDLYPRNGYSPHEDMAHIAAWSPETALGWIRLVQRSALRHYPASYEDSSWTPQHKTCDACEEYWPCTDIKEIMETLGIEGEQ